jgi:hypothetical protein
MYVRTISRKNKSGSTTTYAQLAHNVRDPQTGQPRADVLYSFGRADALDVDAIRRLTKSLSRFLSPEEALKIQGATDGDTPLRFIRSYPMGGAYLLRALWEQLGIPDALSQCIVRLQMVLDKLDQKLREGFSTHINLSCLFSKSQSVILFPS